MFYSSVSVEAAGSSWCSPTITKDSHQKWKCNRCSMRYWCNERSWMVWHQRIPACDYCIISFYIYIYIHMPYTYLQIILSINDCALLICHSIVLYVQTWENRWSLWTASVGFIWRSIFPFTSKRSMKLQAHPIRSDSSPGGSMWWATVREQCVADANEIFLQILKCAIGAAESIIHSFPQTVTSWLNGAWPLTATFSCRSQKSP